MEEGGGWTRWGLGFKEVTWCDEHQVFYVSAESLNSTPPKKKYCTACECK